MGVSQDIAVLQTGYITIRKSDLNFMAHTVCVNPSLKGVTTYFVSIYAIPFDLNIRVEINS